MPALALGVNLANVYVALNNHGQVAGVEQDGSAFVFDPATLQIESFVDAQYREVEGINDAGVFAGRARPLETYAGGKKQRTGNYVAFRYTTVLEPIIGSENVSRVNGFNASGDVSFSITYDPVISHTGFAPDNTEQLLPLKDLIWDGDQMQETFVNNQPEIFGINGRDGTGYSQAVCRLYFPQPDGTNQTVGVILTPFSPTP